MFKPIATALIGAVLVFSMTRSAADAAARKPAEEKVRVERLAGLARTWGAVRYFHPALATKSVDWDRALVEAIPRVNAAKTQADYLAALNAMLAALGDPATRARPASAGTAEIGEPADKTTDEPVRLDHDVLQVNAPLAARRIAEGDGSLAWTLPGKVKEFAAQTRAVVFDLRRTTRANPEQSWAETNFLKSALPHLLSRPVPLPTARYRVHNGYAPQSGFSSGGYYSALVTETPQLLNGRLKDKVLPLVFLVNEYSVPIDLVRGARGAGLAYVVQEGAAPDANDTKTIHPMPGIEVELSVAEHVAADGSVALVADEIVVPGQGTAAAERALAGAFPRSVPAAQAGTAAVPATELDRPYRDMSFPPSEYRLLALFRYWNAIEYLYPYKDLIGGDWRAVLARYIPRFEGDADALDYQRTVTELATEIHDSHSFAGGTSALLDQQGQYVPALRLRWVQNQSVVTAVLDGKLPVKVGDIVLAVDGLPIEQLRQQRAALIAASTPQALQRDVHRRLLRGAKDSQVKLTLRGSDGATREVVVPRALEIYGASYWAAEKRSRPVVEILSGGIGYVDLDRLQNGEVEAMFAKIRGAPAVIFDMRGYPNGTAWAIAPRLGTKQNPVAAKFSRPIVEATWLDDDVDWPRYEFDQRVGKAEGERYTGKVVMLINEDTQSQAEHTGLFFEAATDVTFIGTPSTGANGDATDVVLPGGLSLSFTGHSVRHADGRQLQRLGLQPTIRAEPTIAGLATGHDEVLEAALKFLNAGK